jgi:hypothetical protein
MTELFCSQLKFFSYRVAWKAAGQVRVTTNEEGQSGSTISGSRRIVKAWISRKDFIAIFLTLRFLSLHSLLLPSAIMPTDNTEKGGPVDKKETTFQDFAFAFDNAKNPLKNGEWQTETRIYITTSLDMNKHVKSLADSSAHIKAAFTKQPAGTTTFKEETTVEPGTILAPQELHAISHYYKPRKESLDPRRRCRKR